MRTQKHRILFSNALEENISKLLNYCIPVFVLLGATGCGTPPGPVCLHSLTEYKIKDDVLPDYPIAAYIEGVSGQVTIGYMIGKSGRTKNHTVIESVPAGVFEENSIKAAKALVYEPRKLNCVAVEVDNVTKKFSFAINPNSTKESRIEALKKIKRKDFEGSR